MRYSYNDLFFCFVSSTTRVRVRTRVRVHAYCNTIGTLARYTFGFFVFFWGLSLLFVVSINYTRRHVVPERQPDRFFQPDSFFDRYSYSTYEL
jgi:hypothetical protein